MAKGKKPGLPPRNLLAASAAGVGKRPALPYRQALEALRDKSRLRKFGAAKIGALATMEAPARILLPINPRHHADHLQIGRTDRAERRARGKIEDARRRIEEEICAAEAWTDDDYAASFAAPEQQADPEAERARKPQPVTPDRYSALKDGRPS